MTQLAQLVDMVGPLSQYRLGLLEEGSLGATIVKLVNLGVIACSDSLHDTHECGVGLETLTGLQDRYMPVKKVYTAESGYLSKSLWGSARGGAYYQSSAACDTGGQNGDEI